VCRALGPLKKAIICAVNAYWNPLTRQCEPSIQMYFTVQRPYYCYCVSRVSKSWHHYLVITSTMRLNIQST